MPVPLSNADDFLRVARALAAEGRWGELREASRREPAAAAEPELAILLAEAEMRLGDARAARVWLEYAMPKLGRSGNNPELRKAVNMLGAARFELGDLVEAEAEFERALDLATAAGAHLNIARATVNLGLIANVRGRHSDAIALYRVALPAFQRVGMARELAEAFHNMAITFRDLGQLDQADQHEQRAIEFAQEAGNRRLLAMARVGRGELSLLRGEPRVAEAVAQLAARECANIPDRVGEADALRLAGRAGTVLGAHAEALSALDRAVQLAHQEGSVLVEAEALRARAELFLARREPERARADASDALALYNRLGAAAESAALRRWLEHAVPPDV